MDDLTIKVDVVPNASSEEIVDVYKEVLDAATKAIEMLRESVFFLVNETIQSVASNAGDSLTKSFRPFKALDCLRKAQFVFWDYMDDGFIDLIISSDNINKTLRAYFSKNNYQTAFETAEKVAKYSALSKHQRLFDQSVSAFKCGYSDLAVTGFTSVFDGVLADISHISASSLTPRIKTIKAKLEKEEPLDTDEYATLALTYTFQGTIDSFCVNAPFEKPEPEGLNRHWIAHGRSCRRRTKLDCVKMINLIYGLLLIDELYQEDNAV